MLLWVAEQASALDYDLTDELRSLSLLDPVAAMHTVSHDLTFDEPLALANRGSSTAWQLQVSLHGLVYEVASIVYGTDSLGEPVWPDSQTRSVMAMWRQALIDVAEVRHADDDTRMTMTAQASRLEWLLKWQLLERMRRRIAGCGASSASSWDNPQVRALELRWASLAPENEAVFAKVRSRAERVVTDERIAAAATDAPADTRAWLRAAILYRFPDELRAISRTRITTVADGAGDYGRSTCAIPRGSPKMTPNGRWRRRPARRSSSGVSAASVNIRRSCIRCIQRARIGRVFQNTHRLFASLGTDFSKT